MIPSYPSNTLEQTTFTSLSLLTAFQGPRQPGFQELEQSCSVQGACGQLKENRAPQKTQDSHLGPESLGAIRHSPALPHCNRVTVPKINTKFPRLLFTYFRNHFAASMHSSGFMPGFRDFQIIGSALLNLLAKPLRLGSWLLSRSHTDSII